MTGDDIIDDVIVLELCSRRQALASARPSLLIE